MFTICLDKIGLKQISYREVPDKAGDINLSPESDSDNSVVIKG